MVRRRGLMAWMLALMGGLTLNGGVSRADTEVDVALVLAVDISISMDPEEQELQRQGFVEAFPVTSGPPRDQRRYAGPHLRHLHGMGRLNGSELRGSMDRDQ